MNFQTIPTKREFQHATDVRLAIRSQDIILTQLDMLLDLYPQNLPTKGAILCDLFLTANFWILSLQQGNPRMKRERYDGVLALFDIVVTTLARRFECRVPQVSKAIARYYGRDMHEHGIAIDLHNNQAHYLSEKQMDIYRLRFESGLAYQQNYWGDRLDYHLTLAESYHAYSPVARRFGDTVQRVLDDWGMIVMTLDRKVYMGPPDIGDHGKNNGMFHSSFSNGGQVTFAGTALIRQGRILGLRPDSGHYKPTLMNVALGLQGLAMYGVNLRNVQLYSFDARPLGDALGFLQSNLRWQDFKAQKKNEKLHRQQGATFRANPPVQFHQNVAAFVRGSSDADAPGDEAYNS